MHLVVCFGLWLCGQDLTCGLHVMTVLVHILYWREITTVRRANLEHLQV